MDRLRLRPDAVVPCSGHTEDLQYIGAVTEMVQCVPPYWKRFIPEIDQLHFKIGPECTNKTQYDMIIKKYSPVEVPGFQKVAKMYTQPCTATSGVVITEKSSHASGSVSVVVEFDADTYLNIENAKAFDIGSMWSQIGGFVGIFLGYSLLQVPELAVELMNLFKKCFKKHNAKTHHGLKCPQFGADSINCPIDAKVVCQNVNSKCGAAAQVSKPMNY